MRRFVLVIITLCVVLGVVGCSAGNGVAESTAEPETPVVTQVLKTSKELYSDVLGKYFTALNLKWDADTLSEEGLSTLLAECYETDPFMNVGYAFWDIDADGVEELLIGTANESYEFKNVIFDLYTIQDGKPARVSVSNKQHNYCLLLNDNNEYVVEYFDTESETPSGNFVSPGYLSFKDGSVLE